MKSDERFLSMFALFVCARLEKQPRIPVQYGCHCYAVGRLQVYIYTYKYIYLLCWLNVIDAIHFACVCLACVASLPHRHLTLCYLVTV